MSVSEESPLGTVILMNKGFLYSMTVDVIFLFNSHYLMSVVF